MVKCFSWLIMNCENGMIYRHMFYDSYERYACYCKKRANDPTSMCLSMSVYLHGITISWRSTFRGRELIVAVVGTLLL